MATRLVHRSRILPSGRITGFFFAPVLAVVSPWPTVTAVLWAIIGLTGLWLGLLGIAMAVRLPRILRSGAEIPEDYWRKLVNY
jgi:hypothetical protein